MVVPKEVKVSKKAEEMLAFDLENEKQTIINYRQRIRQAEELGEFALSEVLRKIIAQDLKLTPDVASRMPLFGYWKLTETDLPAVQRYLDLLKDQRIISKHIDARALYLSTDLLKGKTNQ